MTRYLDWEADWEAAKIDLEVLRTHLEVLEKEAAIIQKIVQCDLAEHLAGQSATALQDRFEEKYRTFFSETVPQKVEELDTYIENYINGMCEWPDQWDVRMAGDVERMER